LSVIIGLILASAFSAIIVYAQELVPGRVGMISGLFFGIAFGLGGGRYRGRRHHGDGGAVAGSAAGRVQLSGVHFRARADGGGGGAGAAAVARGTAVPDCDRAGNVQPFDLGGTKSGGSCAPSPKKYLSICSRRNSWAWEVPRLSRYSFMIIFMCSTHIFHASLETLSKIFWPKGCPSNGISSMPS